MNPEQGKFQNIDKILLKKIIHLTARATVTNVDQMLTQIKQGQRKALPIILKTDVNGSMEAISAALRDLQE